MGKLESELVIRAIDDTTGAFASIDKLIEATIAKIDKTAGAVGRIGRSVDATARALTGAQRAFAVDRTPGASIAAGLDRVGPSAMRAAQATLLFARDATAAEEKLQSAVADVSAALLTQGASAAGGIVDDAEAGAAAEARLREAVELASTAMRRQGAQGTVRIVEGAEAGAAAEAWLREAVEMASAAMRAQSAQGTVRIVEGAEAGAAAEARLREAVELASTAMRAQSAQRLGAIVEGADGAAAAERGLETAALLANRALAAQSGEAGAIERVQGPALAAARAEDVLRVAAEKTSATLTTGAGAAERAAAAQTEATGGLAGALERVAALSGEAAEAQGLLLARIRETTGGLASEGREAARVAGAFSQMQRRQAQVAPSAPRERRGGVGDALPFAGPDIVDVTKRAAEAGVSVDEQIARLTAAGAKPEQIAQAREDFRGFSKTHAGVLESDYLGGYKDALTIAPTEPREMAELGARYRAALRNSGLSSSEFDVGNVLRIMDELGLKDMNERVQFLDAFLKSQQRFGSQVSTETALAAYRNAKQSIYDWSPEFREKMFPTLLQSAGQQGGTEMMTGLNNYVGGHMTEGEFKALIAGGFVDNKDVSYPHGKPVLRPGAHLFEADVFKSNIAQWAWDFHDQYMKRKGATEAGFEDLLYKMPRNMSGLLGFLVHNEPRIKRDAAGLDLPEGLKAADDAALASNPGAGLHALGDSITQFAASVTGPAMQAVGPALSATAQGIQNVANAYGEWAAKRPDEAQKLGMTGVGAGGYLGGLLSWRLIAGLGRRFGFGGGAEAADAGGAEAMSGGLLGALAKRMGWLGTVIALTEWIDPKGDFGGLTTPLDAWFKAKFGFDPSNVNVPGPGLSDHAQANHDATESLTRNGYGAGDLARETLRESDRAAALSPWATNGPPPWEPSWFAVGDKAKADLALLGAGYSASSFAGEEKREATRGRALDTLGDGHGPQHVEVAGSATNTITVRVEAGSDLLRIVDRIQEITSQMRLTANSGGRMDSDAAPRGAGGIGHQ